MEELENYIKTIRANNIPIRVDHVRKDSKTENDLSSSKSKVPKEVSAKALLCFFKKIHHNDAPLVVMKTESEESAREVFERRKRIENPMIKKFQNIIDSKSGGSFSKSSRTSNWSKRGLKSFKKDQIWTKISCPIFSRLYLHANNIPIHIDYIKKDSKTDNHLSSSKSKV